MHGPALLSVLTMRPFRDMPKAALDTLTTKPLRLARGESLEPHPGSVYVMLEGAADEMSPSVDGREAHVGFVRPGDSIGWYPISGHLVQRKASLYAVVNSDCGWESWDWLRARVDMINRRLWDTRAQLALLKTTTVAERLRLEPRAPHERLVDVAHRVGSSRETLYRVLRESAT